MPEPTDEAPKPGATDPVRDAARPDEDRNAKAVEHLEHAAAATLRCEDYEADVEEARGLTVSFADIRAEILRVQAKAMGAPGLAVPVDRFEDGCPICESWEREAGGRGVLDIIHYLHHQVGADHGVDGVRPLSRRLVRTMKPFVIEWAREHQTIWFTPQECESSGERFHPQRVHAYLPQYCSNKCRQRAYRARRRNENA